MSDIEKTKSDLKHELRRANERISELEKSESEARNQLTGMVDFLDRLENALGRAGIIVLDWDVETGKMTFHRHWMELLGYSNEDTPPSIMSWVNSFHNPGFAMLFVPDTIKKELNTYWAFKILLQTASKDLLVVGLRDGIIDVDENGNPRRITVVALDETPYELAADEHRPAECRTLQGPSDDTQKLRMTLELINLNLEDRFRWLQPIRDMDHLVKCLFDSNEYPVFVKDRSWKYAAANLRMQDLLGVEEREIVGKSETDLFDDGGIPESDEPNYGPDSAQFVQRRRTITVRGVVKSFVEYLLPNVTKTSQFLVFMGF